MRRTVITAVVACLLGAATVGAVGTAATKKKGSSRQSQTTQTSTTPSTPPPTLKEEMAKRDAARDAQLGKVAADLNVSLSDLKAALDAVRDDRLAAEVKANRLTQAQADAIKACADAPLTCDRSNLPAFRGFRGHHFGGPGQDRDAFFAAVAQKLGKTTAEVKKAFQDNRPARGAGMRRGHGPMGHGPGGHGPRGAGGPGPGMMGPGPGPGVGP
jgi:hypothetical protein